MEMPIRGPGSVGCQGLWFQTPPLGVQEKPCLGSKCTSRSKTLPEGIFS